MRKLFGLAVLLAMAGCNQNSVQTQSECEVELSTDAIVLLESIAEFVDAMTETQTLMQSVREGEAEAVGTIRTMNASEEVRKMQLIGMMNSATESMAMSLADSHAVISGFDEIIHLAKQCEQST